MQLEKFTSTGRPLDMKYKTNNIIAIATPAVMLGAFVFEMFHGGAWNETIWQGIGAGLGVFLAWAIGRELDPDNQYSSILTMVFAIVLLFIWPLPDLLGLFWVLIAMRIINRSTGLPAKITDSLILLILTTVLVYQGKWPYGLAALTVFFLDAVQKTRLKRQWYFVAVASIIILFGIFWWENQWQFSSLPWPYIAAVFAIILFHMVIMESVKVKSKGDITSEPLNPGRVISAQVLVMSLGLLLVLQEGERGLIALSGLWAAVVGSGMFNIFKRIKNL